MASFFDQDFALADALLAESFGGTVRIQRGELLSEPVTAEVVVRNYELLDDETGLQTVVQSREYVVLVTDYQLGGNQVKPRAGDLIRETVGGAECLFELMLQANRPAFEWADADGRQWLLRTNKVG